MSHVAIDDVRATALLVLLVAQCGTDEVEILQQSLDEKITGYDPNIVAARATHRFTTGRQAGLHNWDVVYDASDRKFVATRRS